MITDYLCANKNTTPQKEFCFLCPMKYVNINASSALINAGQFVSRANNMKLDNTISLYNTYSNAFPSNLETQVNLQDVLGLLRLEQKIRLSGQQNYIQTQFDIMRKFDERNKNLTNRNILAENVLYAGAYCGAEYLACTMKNDITKKAIKGEISQSEKDTYNVLVDSGKYIVQDLSKKVIDRYF